MKWNNWWTWSVRHEIFITCMKLAWNWTRNEIETSVHKIPERERAAGRRLLHSRRLWSRNNSQWLVPRCLPNSVSPPCCPPFFSSSSSSLPQRRCEPPVPQHLSTHLIVRPLLSNTHNGIFYLSKHMHAFLPWLCPELALAACMCATRGCGKSETTLPLTWTAVCAAGRPAGCYFAPFTASRSWTAVKKIKNHLKKEEENARWRKNVRVRCVAFRFFNSCYSSPIIFCVKTNQQE